MFSTHELAVVAVDEFRRGLEGLTPDEAQLRQEKADGSRMNAISWTVQHIGAHWANARLVALGMPLERPNPPRDGTPPAFEDARAIFDKATADLTWIDTAGDERMSVRFPQANNESAGTFLARAILHTWFHIGEINAVRQLLGHPPMDFVGDLHGRLAWLPGPA
jgi:hypothetical protein